MRVRTSHSRISDADTRWASWYGLRALQTSTRKPSFARANNDGDLANDQLRAPNPTRIDRFSIAWLDDGTRHYPARIKLLHPPFNDCHTALPLTHFDVNRDRLSMSAVALVTSSPQHSTVNSPPTSTHRRDGPSPAGSPASSRTAVPPGVAIPHRPATSRRSSPKRRRRPSTRASSSTCEAVHRRYRGSARRPQRFPGDVVALPAVRRAVAGRVLASVPRADFAEVESNARHSTSRR